MRIETISIGKLAADPASVRQHSPRNLDVIKASLQKFGQQKPIVVGEKGCVVAGSGTSEAAKALGWKKIDIVRTGLKGIEATAHAIADNRSAELAEWDDAALATMLACR
ncbi:MAG: ParB N-terminal domain-containing protein [Phycisphaerae bacterium]|nr:ParB N-terminal domain-containing protein [Phycisphaerae bacterium]